MTSAMQRARDHHNDACLNNHDEESCEAILLAMELSVAQAEIGLLNQQRDATRIYLGIGLTPEEDAYGEPSMLAVLRRELRAIITKYPDQKIMAIKDVRCSPLINDAWNTLRGNESGTNLLGLKEAKDMVDSAYAGWLYIGVGTKEPL